MVHYHLNFLRVNSKGLSNGKDWNHDFHQKGSRAVIILFTICPVRACADKWVYLFMGEIFHNFHFCLVDVIQRICRILDILQVCSRCLLQNPLCCVYKEYEQCIISKSERLILLISISGSKQNKTAHGSCHHLLLIIS